MRGGVIVIRGGLHSTPPRTPHLVCRDCAHALGNRMQQADQWAAAEGIKAPGEQQMLDFVVGTIERSRGKGDGG